MDSLNNVIPVISHTYDEIESSMVRSSGVGLTDKFITRTFNEVTAKVFRINFSWDDNGDDTPQVQALIFGFTEPPDHYKIERSLDHITYSLLTDTHTTKSYTDTGLDLDTLYFIE